MNFQFPGPRLNSSLIEMLRKIALWSGAGIERHGGWQLASELLPSFPRYHMVRQNYTRRKRKDRQSSSPESVKPPPKAAKSLTDTNEDESVMAASSTEEANISLEDIKETLDSKSSV